MAQQTAKRPWWQISYEPSTGRDRPDTGSFFRRVFMLMFAAVGVTALTSMFVIFGGGIHWLVSSAGLTPFFYVVTFGSLGFVIWIQSRVFSIEPAMAALMLFAYSIAIGFALTPLIWMSLAVNPIAIMQAFAIASMMFAAMALFGYKTVKDLSFLGAALFMGMIGLILVGVVSIFFPLGSTFATIVMLIGVLVFALFTAYSMQFLKRAYHGGGDARQTNQLAVLGALQMYISFIAMFQYILSLLNIRSN